MNLGQPSRKLSGNLKEACDVIYNSNPKKYKRLILWVWRMQKVGHSDEAITECLRLAVPGIFKVKQGGWLYLTKLMQKGEIRAFESRHEQTRAEEAAFFGKRVREHGR